jgi:hypothetical protein
MLRKVIISSFIIFFFLATSSFVHAQDYKTALGVRLSTDQATVNNSVTLKHFLNNRVALEALLTFSDPVALGALFEIHKPFSEAGGLKWYYGAGPYFGFGSKTSFGAQGVVGLDYKFNNIPLNLSLDWKPELNIVSDINFEPAAIGFTARFTFGKN